MADTDRLSYSTDRDAVLRRASSIQVHRALVVGTRGSALAQWQTKYVLEALKRLSPELEIQVKVIKTSGDRDQVSSLAALGGLGVFTKELEHALQTGEIDLAVHSLKDLPTETADGLIIAAVPAREDARDCLVSRSGRGLKELPGGTRVGTSSARRAAQVLASRPDLRVIPLRGNVDTRLRKAQSSEYDAVILAAAGVLRLGRGSEITEYLPFDLMLPDPGQGALAVEIRQDDAALAELLGQIDDQDTRAAVTAERAFLRGLGGGCRMPIGAYAQLEGSILHLRGMVSSLDGSRRLKGDARGEIGGAEALGLQLADELLQQGAAEILDRPPSYQAAGTSPLRGKRIVVTRAAGQAGELVEQIRALGGQPIEYATIQFLPLEDYSLLDAALRELSRFDWVVFTSANGVRAVAGRMQALGLDPRSLPPKVAAIGPGTAYALEAMGVRVDFIPTRFLGEQIALELPAQPGQRALLLRADLASDVLASGLAARGVNVADVDAYRTVAPVAQPLDFGSVDALTFTSSSTVANFVRLSPQAIAANGPAIFCIGPVTAQTARELGLPVAAVAREHTINGLVRALVEYYTRGEETESENRNARD